MTGESPLAEHFADLAERTPAQREARLAELARLDPRLAAELRRLLAARGRAEQLFDTPATEAPGPDGEPPRRIDSYRIVREIGRGGMGRVFLAEQETESWKRRVALKVLDSALPSEREIRRFREEVRILASLEHPGIARFLDGGRSDGTWRSSSSTARRCSTTPRAGSSRPKRGSASCSRSSTRSVTPTRRTSSTATSSRPTSWWTRPGGRGCSTSASRSCSRRTNPEARGRARSSRP
jgi:hypothetical protein